MSMRARLSKDAASLALGADAVAAALDASREENRDSISIWCAPARAA